MMLLAVMDPDGTKMRKSRRLKRRIYLNKGPNCGIAENRLTGAKFPMEIIDL